MRIAYKGNLLGGGGSSGDGGASIPSGIITMWSGTLDTIPNGWALCNGENGTPDLRGRFVLCVTTDVDDEGNTAHHLGETGGSEEVTLTTAQMPSHNHDIQATLGVSGYSEVLDIYKSTNKGMRFYSTGNSGSSQPHPNMPPYYVLAYIMKL